MFGRRKKKLRGEELPECGSLILRGGLLDNSRTRDPGAQDIPPSIDVYFRSD